jgi:hypothetical protein
MERIELRNCHLLNHHFPPFLHLKVLYIGFRKEGSSVYPAQCSLNLYTFSSLIQSMKDQSSLKDLQIRLTWTGFEDRTQLKFLADLISQTKVAQSLHTLKLWGTREGSERESFLQSLFSLQQLKQLTIHGYSFREEEQTTLASLLTTSKLKDTLLDLWIINDYSNMTKTEEPLVNSIMELKRIKKLQLKGYIFPSESAEILQRKGVTFSDFFQDITEAQYFIDGANKLSPFENSNSLESLRILNSHLENQQFPSFTKLKVIDIDSCFFDENTLKSLAESVSQVCSLEKIKFHLPRKGNTNYQQCLQMTHLSHLLTQPTIQKSLQRLKITEMKGTEERIKILQLLSSLQRLKQLNLSLESLSETEEQSFSSSLTSLKDSLTDLTIRHYHAEVINLRQSSKDAISRLNRLRRLFLVRIRIDPDAITLLRKNRVTIEIA